MTTTLDPDAVARWKADTTDAYARLIVLHEKALDNGLSPEERAEKDRLESFVDQRLSQFLDETGRNG